MSGNPLFRYSVASGRSEALTQAVALVPVSRALKGTPICMSAASPRLLHASTVASADSVVSRGGSAEKPMRNVRGVRDDVGDVDPSPGLQTTAAPARQNANPVSAYRATATRRILPI